MAFNLNFLKGLLPKQTVYVDKLVLEPASGTDGTEIYAGYYSEEYLNELRGAEGAKLYDMMRRQDSQVAMLLSVIKNPIKSASWLIEPVDDSEKEKEIAAFAEHVLFKDIKNPKTGLKKTFSEVIEEALTCIEFGHSVFEKVHKTVKGHPIYGDYIGLKTLGFRSQKTIEQWGIAQDGSIYAITQLVNGDLDVNATIKGQSLLVFSINKEGANYEGISMLRPCYGNYFRKSHYQKLMAIGIEKTAIGVPVAKMDKEFLDGDNYSEQYGALKKLLQQFAAHEVQSLALPAGVEMQSYKIEFDAAAVQAAIDAEDVKMTKRFLANFMELGVGGGSGSYSLGSDLSDLFLSGIEYYAKSMCEKINSDLLEPLIKAKYGEREDYPTLTCTGINDKAGKELADIINGFIEKGVIAPDDRLSQYVRKRYKLPEMSDDQMTDGDDDNEPNDEPPAPQDPIDENDEDTEADDEPEKEDSKLSAADVVQGIIDTYQKKRFNLPKAIAKSINLAEDLNVKYGREVERSDIYLDVTAGNGLTMQQIARMASQCIFSDDYEPTIKLDDGGATHGTIKYLYAGGEAGIEWAQKKIAEIEQEITDVLLSEPKIANMQASSYIKRRSNEFGEQMKERLLQRSDIMLDKTYKILKGKKTKAQKTKAVLELNMPKQKQYKDFMAAFLGDAGRDTLEGVLKELGRTDKKFSTKDFDGLPKRAKQRIKNEIDLVAEYQDADLEKMVYFTINDEIDKGTSAAEIIAQIKKQRERYFVGQNIKTAATNLTSKTVNGVRNDVFQEPDILDDIESFIFVNASPKAAICINLKDRVMSKEEYENSPYLPPLHHNCNSTIAAQTKGKKGNKPLSPEGFTPTGTSEEIEKILKSKTL